MKNVKNVLLSTLVMLSLFVVGCSDDDNDYVGSNKVLMSAEGSTELTVGEKNQEVVVKVTFTKKADKDTPLNVVIANKTDANNNDIVSVEGTPTLKVNTREVDFKVKLNKGVTVFKDNIIELSLKFTDTQFAAVTPLNITVKPAIAVAELTPEQIALLEGYKAEGMDISPFIGKIDVVATVHSAKDGYLKDYVKEWTKEFEGVTVITLSEKATADKPILKMVSNAMGANEFFHKVMRDETIDNDEYWYGEYAGPLYAKVMELINWNKTSEETFSTLLDGIVIEKREGDKSELSYIGKVEDSYGDKIDVVPFEFKYTAWDRLKKLIDEGNADAVECNEGGATSNPNFFLNNTGILEDEYESGAFRATTGELNYKIGVMKFSFITSHTNGGDYVQIEAVYTK